MISLYSHQLSALDRMKNGCILCGDVGSGKSITAISYYYLKMGGNRSFLTGGEYSFMNPETIKDLYIITTARKRDTNEWGLELALFLLDPSNPDDPVYNHKVIIDSWNNIKKYSDIKNAFFIFDEQRVIGNGAWTKSFYSITKSNEWILLSATPGDTWSDYIPVFIANGFFKNRTEFNNSHVIFDRFAKYPKVKAYYNEAKLIKLRNDILVSMKDTRETVEHHVDVICDYDKETYDLVYKKRWNPFDLVPIENAPEWCYIQRKVVNSDRSRVIKFYELLEEHPKVIVFYNFNYELDIIRDTLDGVIPYAEWNGHNHDSIPNTDTWVYLVQYAAGCEGWNCTSTDTIIFWSQNYSYRVMRQAAGRINRLNTKFKDLYYFHLKSNSIIDKSISMTIKRKKNFNIKKFAGSTNWRY